MAASTRRSLAIFHLKLKRDRDYRGVGGVEETVTAGKISNCMSDVNHNYSFVINIIIVIVIICIIIDTSSTTSFISLVRVP